MTARFARYSFNTFYPTIGAIRYPARKAEAHDKAHPNPSEEGQDKWIMYSMCTLNDCNCVALLPSIVLTQLFDHFPEW